MRFVSMGIHRNALWLFNIAVSLIFLAGVNRIQGAVSSYPSLSQRYASLADRAIPGYKINPKPCRVKGREGTCMFVWECIKTEGQALGMCVEGFMFGSCCAHDVDNNVVPNSNPNQAEHSAPVSTTLFGLPTRPVTVRPHQLEMEKQGEEDSAQEITMAPLLITSRPLVVDMAAVTVEPVETTAPSVWQRPTVTSTTTTTTTRPPTTTERKVVTWVQSTSAPLASNAGTEQQQLGEEVEETFTSTYLLETTTPTAPLYQSSTSHPPTTLPVTTNASHIVLTNSIGILETTIPSNLDFTMTDVPLTLFSTLPKDAGSQTDYAVADEPLALSIPTTTWSPASIMTTSMLTRPGTDLIKPNQNKNPNYHPFYVVRTKPTARPSPTTTTTVKTKVTLGGQRRPATTVRPLRRTTMLPVVTQATIQRFTPTKSKSTYRPKTTTSAMSTSTTTVASQDGDAITAMVLTMESVNATTFSMPTSSAISTSTLYSVLDSTVSPAEVSLPEMPPLNAVSPPPSEIPVWFTEEPTSTSTARSPSSSSSSSFGTTTAFTTASSTLSSTSSSTPSTSPDPSNTTKRPVAAQLPTSQSVSAQSTPPNPTTVTTAMIPTVSMITDNAWTPITQASNSPSTTTIASTSTSTIASSTGTPLSTQPSRFPPFSPVTAIPSNDLVVECGVPQPFLMPELRIVGGRDATFGAWPWQVSVRRTSFFGFSSTHRCGGALLNEQWIITAGHCVEDLLINQIRLRLGEYDFASTTEPYPYIEKGASKKVVHPKYNFFTYEYDLALVRLEEPINFMPHIKPICLPAIDELMVGENATVTGWGRLSEGGTLPSKLQQVTVPIVSNEKCKNMFLKTGRNEYIPEIFMCAGYEDGGRDSCQGDSGGPLQARGKDGRYFLAGIISWGIGCAEKNLPGVCTRISKFTSWILENAT